MPRPRWLQKSCWRVMQRSTKPRERCRSRAKTRRQVGATRRGGGLQTLSRSLSLCVTSCHVTSSVTCLLCKFVAPSPTPLRPFCLSVGSADIIAGVALSEMAPVIPSLLRGTDNNTKCGHVSTPSVAVSQHRVWPRLNTEIT